MVHEGMKILVYGNNGKKDKMNRSVKHWFGRVMIGLAGSLLVAIAGLYIAYLVAYGDLKTWAESESFRQMISHQVSRALKVHGQFGEIELSDGLTIHTDSFESEGRAGEAIGSLNAYGIESAFNPWAIFKRVWELKYVKLSKGTFQLRMPDDALKQSLSQGPKPWYSLLMPQRFHCGEITCPDADIVFPFQGEEGRLSHLNLTATMVGQDFKYHGRNGLLEFPYFPKMRVDELNMYITREMADIEQATLSGVDGDPATAEISARIGMREDKSIHAKVKTGQMPVARILPPEWQGKLSGRLSGDVNWNTDKTGKNIQADGTVKLSKSELKQLALLDELARVHGNQELQSFLFDEVSCDFEIKDKELKAKQLRIEAPGSFYLEGSGDYNWEEKRGRMEVDVRELPLSKWLPKEVQAEVEGMARARLKWSGHVDDPEKMTASGEVNIDGATIRNPIRFQSLLEPHGIMVPQNVDFNVVKVSFQYEERDFAVENLYLETQNSGRLSFNGSWDRNNQLSLRGSITQVNLSQWMKDNTRQDIRGRLWISGDWQCSRWDLEKGTGYGWLGLEEGCFRGWGIQKTLVRFLKDDSWLMLEVDPVKLEWESQDGRLAVQSIDILSPGKLGVRGSLQQGEQNQLSGVIWLGLTKENLSWLPGATNSVFTKQEDGLYWAKVTMSGTVEKPEHDLDDQIRGQLLKHPLALIGLGLRGVSWWAGDVLGTYAEPVALPECVR
jgi:hypothetical protein